MLFAWRTRLVLLLVLLHLLSGCFAGTTHERAAVLAGSTLIQVIGVSESVTLEEPPIFVDSPSQESTPLPQAPSPVEDTVTDLDRYVCLRGELDGILDYASLLIAEYSDPDNLRNSFSTWYRKRPDIGMSFSDLHVHFYTVLLRFDGLQLPEEEGRLYQIYLDHHPRMYDHLDEIHDLAAAGRLDGEGLLAIIDRLSPVVDESQAEYTQFWADRASADHGLHEVSDDVCTNVFSELRIQPMSGVLRAANFALDNRVDESEGSPMTQGRAPGESQGNAASAPPSSPPPSNASRQANIPSAELDAAMARGKDAFDRLSPEYDAFSGITRFFDSYLVSGKIENIVAELSMSNSPALGDTLLAGFSFVGNTWLFLEGVDVLAGGDTHTFDVREFVVRDVFPNGVGVYELSLVPVFESDYPIFLEVARAPFALVRGRGSNEAVVSALVDGEWKGIRDVLLAYGYRKADPQFLDLPDERLQPAATLADHIVGDWSIAANGRIWSFTSDGRIVDRTTGSEGRYTIASDGEIEYENPNVRNIGGVDASRIAIEDNVMLIWNDRDGSFIQFIAQR